MHLWRHYFSQLCALWCYISSLPELSEVGKDEQPPRLGSSQSPQPFKKDIFNKNTFWKNESCTPLILPIVDIFLLNSSFKTLTSLLKLWQPLQIRFDISMDENVKLYFDFFFCRGKMGRHVQAYDAAGHDIERLSILWHIVCTNRRYYAKENTLKTKFRNL